MTKKKKLILIFSIIGAVIVAATATVLIAVLSKKKPEEEQTNKASCVAPEITVADEGIYWASVANAEIYYYNYNSGEWTEAKDIIEFPDTEGEYTLQLKAVDGEGRDGKTTEFAFTVAKMTVECEQVDNTLRFEGDRIFFSVNGMEEGALGESKILDFSNDTTGTKYTVQYYAKGGYFSEEDNTFYLDSVKQTQELTTMQMLTMPTLKANEAGTHLVWTASENAQSYAVSVDGEKTTVSKDNASVAFPMTEGEHVITVQAIGDGQTWYSSFASEYKMTTKREAVPTITFDSRTDKVLWEEKYASKMQISTDGNTYTPLNATNAVAQVGMTLKVGAYYAESERIYYLESKPVSFEKREVSLPAFSIDGYVNWNTADETHEKKYFVSVVEQTQAAEYTRLNENVKNVSFLSAGAYTLSVYAADYVEEQSDRVVFYLPSDAKEIDFSVLASPTLSFEKGKLLWEIDPLAASYEYRVNGTGEWEAATESGVLRTRDMATYEVRAIGSEETGKYALTSGASALFFDPELNVAWDYGKADLALFNHAAYQQIISSANVSNATKTGKVEVVTSANASSDEQAILAGANGGGALKVTAGNAAPFRKAYWGNSDGASIELFQPLPVVQDARIVFRVYVVPNEARKTAWSYNYTGEHLNQKGRTIDAYGNTYAYFDEENNLVGYQSDSNTLIDASGNQIGTIDTKSYIATVTATGEVTKARTIYGILDDSDNLLGVADENGVVKNGGTTVGTLNAKGELIVNNNVISTSAVKLTSNMEGKFIFSVLGNKHEGGFREYNTWFTEETSAIKVGEWTEVSVMITSGHASVLADIQSVHMHFFANGQEGNTFYIDEIRYDENAAMVEAPSFLKDNGEVGPSYYSVREFSDFKPTVTTGTDEHGEYIDYDWGDYKNGWGKDAITFYFDNIQLNAGDKVYIRCSAYSGRYTRVDVNYVEASKPNNVYDTIINCNDVGGDLYQEVLCYTAGEETQLNTLSIRPYAWSVSPLYLIHFRIYGVYVVRAE